MLRTIRSRLFLLVGLASLAFVALGALVSVRSLRARAEAEQLSNLDVARTAAAALRAQIDGVARASAVLGHALDGGRILGEDAAHLLSVAVQDSGVVRDLSWVAPDGRVVASSDARLHEVSFADRAELRRLLAGDAVAVGDLVRNPADGAPVVAVATAVRDGAGRLSGALLAAVDPERLAARVLPAREGEGSVGIVDRAGRLVARVPAIPLAWDDRLVAGAQDLVRAALAGAEATGPMRSEGGGPARLAAAVPVPELAWAVRATQPRADMLAPMRRELAIGVLGAGLVALVALGASWAVGAHTSRALRRLERHAAALGRGEAPEPLTGPDEVVRLGAAYAQMARHLDAVRRRFEAAFAEAPVGVLILDPAELRARWANPAYLAFLDAPFRGEGVQGLRLEEFLPRAQEAGLVALLREVAAGDVAHEEQEYRYDGFARGPTWWRWSVRAVESGGGTRDLVLMVTEVTEQVRGREQVEADRRRLEAVLRVLPVGVLIADAGGQVVQANDAARRIWGSRAPLRPGALYREQRARRADSGAPLAAGDWALQRALRSGEAVGGELVEIDRFDGTQAVVLNGAAPIRDGEGRVVGAVTTLLDVTELRRAVRNRDEVLQVVSHDLRTPLSAVTLGAAALTRLPDGPEAAAQARRAAARLAAAGRRMNRLIDDLLDLETLEEGRLSMRPEPCDPADLLGEAADQLREAARAKGLDLCLSAAPGLPPVACDRDRVLQVLGNVASNAVKATEEGAVCLAAEAQADGAVIFRVRDTGPGIPDADLPHVFDRFQRGSAARWRGSGLGLAIARGLVEAHGGRIWAESAPGAGTTVSFTLPPAAAPDEAAHAATA
ncbi:PAS/PAC sensor signal transduction histidine kinase [Anaeromyxobacter dehalogenans 2CP-1]|uniref:histidine kinase n=1 Tax=Anaeromyxobacter dehalogenans (strain ATCC BAA-258 / DSM 21875 / 2CP-1) TaxID=455488 RepID=B8JGD2_ANAD2|nr:ATP-binding protein [Anaeromyxobacter dehalogenans]ACL64603.1 PAS/PAC sensor signal transduction histidine kinase [Anaeromyxobacter dehalogenans 2CP-1]